MLNPKQLIEFAMFSTNSEYINFQKQKNNTPVYKLLPNITDFCFFSNKLQQLLITYKSLALITNKWIVTKKTHEYEWLYLNKNNKFDSEFNINTKTFNSIDNVIDYIKPNWNYKLKNHLLE